MVTLAADNTPVTTSLAVAESFGKRHGNVVRDIEALDVTDDFNQLNFESVTYQDKKGESRKAYLMTRDGFLELALRYRGKKAAEFKEALFNEFVRSDQPHL